MTVPTHVTETYSQGAKRAQQNLCCPVSYDARLLEILPREIIECDYGCGDPSKYVSKGDHVLDLGCGAGKICYMAAQIIGKEGMVIGVDANVDMLALARRYQGSVAEKLGHNRVRFVRAHIQDLAEDLDEAEARLAEFPVSSTKDLAEFENWRSEQRKFAPAIPDSSVDVVISNCVLNLVRNEDRQRLVREIHRVLKPGGRVAISDVISDEDVPEGLQRDEELWAQCLTGAFQEKAFLMAFREAGFVELKYAAWEDAPWRVIEGIEFRSVTLVAVKPTGAECLDRGDAVIYRGPYARVVDDEGHIFERGVRSAVCERTFRFLTSRPEQSDFIGIAASGDREPTPWCAPPGTVRPVSETKTRASAETSKRSQNCAPGSGCCDPSDCA